MDQRRRSGREDSYDDSQDEEVTSPLLVQRPKEDGAATAGDERRWYQWVCSYPSYVLLLMTLTYLLNQLDRYMLAITTQPLARDIHYGDKDCSARNSSVKANCNATTENSCELDAGCAWDYNGQGLQYQILAGPVFILVYTFAGIFISFAADLYNRKNMLAVCLVFWSLATVLTGLVKEYWHLVLLRFMLGFGEAGCTPFAVSVLTDYFPPKLRGTVIGVYNLGIYSGYSMSYAVGNFITLADIMGQGWRWAFYLSGIPGVVLGVLILLSVREPPRRTAAPPSGDQRSGGEEAGQLTWTLKLKRTLKPFATVSVILLCLGGSVRNAAGYVWAYNTQAYFKADGQTKEQIATYMSWVPLVGGSIGVIAGGQVSDFVMKRMGVTARVFVLTVSQFVAAPFAAATLYFSPPVAYIMQLPTYIIGEMWVGVALTVLVELVEPQFKTSAIAVYLFIITNIGGSVPLLVPPIREALEGMHDLKLEAFRGALYILYPCLYIGGGVLFLMTVFSLRRDQRRLAYTRLQASGSAD